MASLSPFSAVLKVRTLCKWPAFRPACASRTWQRYQCKQSMRRNASALHSFCLRRIGRKDPNMRTSNLWTFHTCTTMWTRRWTPSSDALHGNISNPACAFIRKRGERCGKGVLCDVGACKRATIIVYDEGTGLTCLFSSFASFAKLAGDYVAGQRSAAYLHDSGIALQVESWRTPAHASPLCFLRC